MGNFRIFWRAPEKPMPCPYNLAISAPNTSSTYMNINNKTKKAKAKKHKQIQNRCLSNIRKNRLPSGAKGDKMPNSQSSVPNVDTEQSINGVPMPTTIPGPTRTTTAAIAAHNPILGENMPEATQEMQVDVASKSKSQTSEDNMIAVGFTPDLLDLTLEQKTEICNQLTQNPNPDNLGEILYSLGFRNNNGKISFVKKNVVYEVNQQELIQSFRYCFSGQLPQLKAAFFGRIGTLTNQTALKHIAGYDPEIDGYPCRHDRYHFYTPYLNGVLKVDGKGYINIIPYEGFNMLVNASEIRPRPVLVTDETVKESYWQRSDFWKFTKNQATDPISKSFDPDLHEAIRMAVVKIMHQYHNKTFAHNPQGLVKK